MFGEVKVQLREIFEQARTQELPLNVMDEKGKVTG